jgi:hypothetical protein
MLDLLERKNDELDKLTIAIAQGYGISMSSEYAAKWTAEHAAPAGPSQEAVHRQSASIGRLAAMFPNAVKTRAH